MKLNTDRRGKTASFGDLTCVKDDKGLEGLLPGT